MKKLPHRLKFALWSFSRAHPHMGGPIRYMAKYATKGFPHRHKAIMRNMQNQLLPPCRYERGPEISCQFIILLGYNVTPAEVNGVKILLNHLRIPYNACRRKDFKEFVQRKSAEPFIVVAVKYSRADIEEILTILPERGVRIINLNSDRTLPFTDKRVTSVEGNPADLLPYNRGLRSSLTGDFIVALLNSDFPIINGFLPPRIGLRIDDVAGAKSKEYLAVMTDKGWAPNLGIFVDDFKEHASNCAGFISSLIRSKMAETSPHSFSADEFIFYDYKRARPFSRNEFNDIWQKVMRRFERWGFPISPVVNSHFHGFR